MTNSSNRNNNNNNNKNNKNNNNNKLNHPIQEDNRPTTPQNKHPLLFNPFNSPRTPHPIPLSHPPSPTPRDDIIEGMSASTGSIFERDVENFDASLTAQEAIQLAVPPVLDEAIEALATVSPEHILVDQIPLEYHLFNSTLSANSIDHTQPPSPNNNNNNNNNPSLPASSSSSSPHNQLTAISLSTPTAAHHQQSRSIPSYPFPSFNSPAQLSPSRSSSHPPPPSPPSIPPRLHHQTLSCTSDTASISDPSSPRSLSPTPSFKIGRSMFTQLATDPDSIATLANNNHSAIPAEILSTNALLKNDQQPATLLSPAQPVQQILFTNNDNTNNKPDHEQTPQTFRQRKTCISFMSYVDILNSERSDHSSDSVAPSSSAMNALRMARKSTSSLVKRASSIFSHSSRVRSSSKKNNLLSTSPNENLGKAWVNRSRCTSSNTTYHSCPTQRSASELQHNPSAGLETPEAEAEVLGEFHWN